MVHGIPPIVAPYDIMTLQISNTGQIFMATFAIPGPYPPWAVYAPAHKIIILPACAGNRSRELTTGSFAPGVNLPGHYFIGQDFIKVVYRICYLTRHFLFDVTFVTSPIDLTGALILVCHRYKFVLA